MALIKCPECGKEISDKAKMCIHCGYPLEELNSNTIQPEESETTEEYDTYNLPPITQKYQVIMTSYGINKTRIAEELEDVKIVSSDEANELLDNLPGCIMETYSYDEARKIKASLSEIGAYVIIKKNSCHDEIKLQDKNSNLFCIQLQNYENISSDVVSKLRLYNRSVSNIYYNDLLVTGLPLKIIKEVSKYLFDNNIVHKILVDPISNNTNEQVIEYINTHLKDEKVKCPKCGSIQITTGQRGYSFWTGFWGSSKTVNRCAKCGYKWEP